MFSTEFSHRNLKKVTLKATSFHISRLVFQQYTYLIIHVTLFPQGAWFSFHPMTLAQATTLSKDYSNYIE